MKKNIRWQNYGIAYYYYLIIKLIDDENFCCLSSLEKWTTNIRRQHRQRKCLSPNLIGNKTFCRHRSYLLYTELLVSCNSLHLFVYPYIAYTGLEIELVNSLHIQFLYCNVILHLDYRITLAAGVVLCKITFVMLISSGVMKNKLHNFNYYFWIQ